MKKITITKTSIRKNLTVFSLSIFSLVGYLLPVKAEAKSARWTISAPVSFGTVALGSYCDTSWCKPPDYEGREAYVKTGHVINVSVTINYSGVVKNVTKVTEGDAPAISVGDSIRFYPTPDSGTDISWNGTGGGDDTPYGKWTTDRSVPCDSTTQVFYATGAPTAKYWGYMNLNVDPKTVTISKSGTATLSCSDAYNCTVTDPGTINVTMTWPATTGHFNYRYSKTGTVSPAGNWVWEGTCRGAIVYDGSVPYPHLYDTVNVISPTEYVLSVPAKSVSFTLTATDAPSVEVYFSTLDKVKNALKNFFTSFLDSVPRVFASTASTTKNR